MYKVFDLKTPRPTGNNSILCHGKRTLMTYSQWKANRFVDGGSTYIIDLDEQFDPIGRPKLLVEDNGDGRLCLLNGKVYMSYTTSDKSKPLPNTHTHICQLDDDLNIVRDLHLNPLKRRDKNWTFCSANGNIFCIYDYQPKLTVWRMNDDFRTVEVIHRDSVSWPFGEIRGNTPPLLVGSDWVTIVHSWMLIDQKRAYFNAVLRMNGNFDILSLQAINLGIDLKTFTFPCGLTERNGRVFVAYGIGDRLSAVQELHVSRPKGVAESQDGFFYLRSVRDIMLIRPYNPDSGG